MTKKKQRAGRENFLTGYIKRDPILQSTGRQAGRQATLGGRFNSSEM
jgi:hypothetical protein